MAEYRDFPIKDVIKQVNERGEQLAKMGIKMRVHQKWTCEHCGSRQTMGEQNRFFAAGTCEACGEVTIIKRCNWLAIMGGTG